MDACVVESYPYITTAGVEAFAIVSGLVNSCDET